ncbi:GAF domain-containing protein [Rhodococcus qingshengii]|uniref:GAF domain-containing protein n=1 Tax=Rhodococcus qingshengii TaxID=334542 RepID=UPI0021B0B538|nr:GAF domain-containing protein [Rhodococcus qingshengii]MCT6735384.1 DUF5593 domain-containing protein [Rhodococcus qingshengii]
MAQGRKSPPNWLLIETFGGNKKPTVVGVGGRPVAFIPIDKFFERKGVEEELRRAIVGCIQTRGPWKEISEERHIEAHPLFLGEELHGLWFWSQLRSVPVPEHNDAGAWLIDLTSLTAIGSPEWARMADIPKEFWGQERSVAAMFNQVDTSDQREDSALAKIEQEQAGEEHQGEWHVERQDESKWRAHFSLRIKEVRRGPKNEIHKCSIGLSQNRGEIDDSRPDAAPSLAILEHRYLSAIREPGEHHALISMTKLKLIRWVTDPAPGISWQGVASEAPPAIHPDDIPAALAIAKALPSRSGEGMFRIRTVAGEWLPVPIKANRVELDTETEAAYVRIFLPTHTV